MISSEEGIGCLPKTKVIIRGEKSELLESLTLISWFTVILS